MITPLQMGVFETIELHRLFSQNEGDSLQADTCRDRLEYIAAMDFHHVNPDDKMFEVKDLMVRKWELIQSKIDKCILLCSNCHREEHWNERNKQ
jgi:hypothetical protein